MKMIKQICIYLIIVILLFATKAFCEDLTDLNYFVSQLNVNWKLKNYKRIKEIIDKRNELVKDDLPGLFAKIQYLILFGDNNDINEIEKLSKLIKAKGNENNWGNDKDLAIKIMAYLLDTENVSKAKKRGGIGPGLTKEQLKIVHSRYKNFPFSDIILKLGLIK